MDLAEHDNHHQIQSDVKLPDKMSNTHIYISFVEFHLMTADAITTIHGHFGKKYDDADRIEIN